MVKKQIVNECLDHLISKLEDDILFDILTYRYGKFRIKICDYQNNVDFIKIEYSDDLNFDTSYRIHELEKIDFYQEYPKFVWFWYNKNKKEDIRRLNKLYKLCNLRLVEGKKQEDIKMNKALIDCLPEDRKKQIYREAKLKRIIDEN